MALAKTSIGQEARCDSSDRNYPQIYQLEREWFDHIASASLASRVALPAP